MIGNFLPEMFTEYDDEMYGYSRPMTRKVYETPCVGDFVRIRVRNGCPIVHDGQYDSEVTLRVLGLKYSGGNHDIILLVNGGDESVLLGRIKLDSKIVKEFGIDQKFSGLNSVIVSDYHICEIKKVIGAMCDICRDHNEWADNFDPQTGIKYRCFSCRQNPYRK